MRLARAEAGISIVLGTDTDVRGVVLGVSSQIELLLHVEAGLSPTAALMAATAAPARMIGRDGELGGVEAGKRPISSFSMPIHSPTSGMCGESFASSKAAGSTMRRKRRRNRPCGTRSQERQSLAPESLSCDVDCDVTLQEDAFVSRDTEIDRCSPRPRKSLR
jgi:hypothetical protein